MSVSTLEHNIHKLQRVTRHCGPQATVNPNVPYMQSLATWVAVSSNSFAEKMMAERCSKLWNAHCTQDQPYTKHAMYEGRYTELSDKA